MKKIVFIVPMVLLIACGGEEDISPPERFNLSSASVSGITISWSDLDRQLEVQVSESSDFTTIVLEETFDTSPSILEGLSSSTQYYIRGRSVTRDGKSGFTEVNEFVTLELTAPSDINIGSVLGDSFQVTWRDIPGATYELDVAEDQGFSTFVEGFEAHASVNNFVIVEVLNPMTDYYVRLRTINGTESSENTSVIPVQTNSQLFFTIRSEAFIENGNIPNQFSCAGSSPPLNWRNVPEGTESLALIMCDLDFINGVYNHWIVFNMAPGVSELPEAASGSNIPGGGREGTNGLAQARYFGPCPPAGESHRYTFTIYALDKRLGVNSTVTIGTFRQAITGSVISSSTLMGRYQR